MKFRCLTLAVTAALFAPASHAASVSLDGQWQFCRTKTAAAPEKSAEWQEAKVPSIMGQSTDLPFVWFRRSFDVPRDFRNRHVFIRFGAVRFVSAVSLNGKEVGGHCGGWEPFEIDITRTCRWGQPNDLLMRVQDVTGVIE